MHIVTRIADLQHPARITTGLVPTLGSFHEGHLSLMRAARVESDRVVVTLFVNPTQFAQGEDFERYPRDLDRDARLAEEAGVDVLFAPSVGEIYPRPGTTVHVPHIAQLWEGAIRPTHFEGVATVVCKLFNIVRPDVAYFGLKDIQQCMVISRMVADLNMPLRLSFQPTVREADGLAMSSRNVYLAQEERQLAPLIFQNLTRCKNMLASPDVTEQGIEEQLMQAKAALKAAGLGVDYFELIELETADVVRSLSKPSALIAAARLGKTRLIDNVLL